MRKPLRLRPQLESLDPRLLLSTAIPEREPNDLMSQATEVNFDARDGGADLSGTIRTAADVDFFHFRATTPASVSLVSAGADRFRGLVTVTDGARATVLETRPDRGINAGAFNVSPGQDVFVRVRTPSTTTGPYAVQLRMTTPIAAKYAELGGRAGFLGDSETVERASNDGLGRFQNFQNGSIAWSPATGAHEVHGAIRDKWFELRSRGDFSLGYPVSDELDAGGGRVSHFQNGSIYWSVWTGAHVVSNPIRDHWVRLRDRGVDLGYPTSDVFGPLRAGGQGVHYQRGSIYWSPATGAHEVHGAIRDKWASLRWENSYLGYPTSDEMDDGHGGRVSRFQGGSIYWSFWGGARDFGMAVS